MYIYHIGFESDIPEYKPKGDTKAWHIMLPDAERLLCDRGANILVKSPQTTCDMFCEFLNRNKIK